MKSDNRPRKYRKDTLLTHLGRHPEAHHGAVNPPVYHASTILSSNMAEWEAKRDPSKRFDVVRYGLLGTPTTFALEEAVAANPDWILITSWNEWHEGSEIEPSVEYGDRSLKEVAKFAPGFSKLPPKAH